MSCSGYGTVIWEQCSFPEVWPRPIILELGLLNTRWRGSLTTQDEYYHKEEWLRSNAQFDRDRDLTAMANSRQVLVCLTGQHSAMTMRYCPGKILLGDALCNFRESSLADDVKEYDQQRPNLLADPRTFIFGWFCSGVKCQAPLIQSYLSRHLAPQTTTRTCRALNLYNHTVNASIKAHSSFDNYHGARSTETRKSRNPRKPVFRRRCPGTVS